MHLSCLSAHVTMGALTGEDRMGHVSGLESNLKGGGAQRRALVAVLGRRLAQRPGPPRAGRGAGARGLPAGLLRSVPPAHVHGFKDERVLTNSLRRDMAERLSARL